jgi:hypothetical protein
MTFTNIVQQCNSDWIGKQVKQYLYQFLSNSSGWLRIFNSSAPCFTVFIIFHVTKVDCIADKTCIRNLNVVESVILWEINLHLSESGCNCNIPVNDLFLNV